MSSTVYYNSRGEDITDEVLNELDELVVCEDDGTYVKMPKATMQDPKMFKRETILSEAERVICNDRQDQYGNAEDSFQLIANFWNVYLQKKLDGPSVITSYDVARMMTLLKLARSMSNPMHQDNDIDICGYTAIAAELAYEEWAENNRS